MTQETACAIIAGAIQAGQPQRAERLARDALRLHPCDESLLLLLALSLQCQRRMGDALAVYADLTRLYAGNATHWSNYGSVLSEVGEWKQAKDAYQRAVDMDPGNPITRDLYGLLLIECREYQAAREMLLEAHLLDPEVVAIRLHAARACSLCQDFENANELLKHWRAWLPLGDDGLQLDLAQVLSLYSDVPGAGWLLEDLLERQPGRVDAKMLLASIYERQNRLADAETLAREIADTPGCTASQRNEADHLLANLALRCGDATAARQLLEQAGPKDGDAAEHYFQMAGVCDKLGDHLAALQALQQAHRIDVMLRSLDSPEYFGAGVAAMPSEAPRVDAEQYARWPALIAPSMHDSPIFVVGFPRSGTTLLEQMLDAHPHLQSMDENPFFNRLAGILHRHDERVLQDLSVLRQYDCDELRKRYQTMVGERIERDWSTRLVDKNPLNMQWLPMIQRLFPDAKIILAIRHPCDVILSCYMQHFRSSALAASCSSLERLARAYVETMQQWLVDVDVFKPDVWVSRYEDLVGDFQGRTLAIADFLGLDDPTPMLQFDQHARNKSYIATPSYSQVVEPINRKAVARWVRYREAFEPIMPILQPMLDHWGYSAQSDA